MGARHFCRGPKAEISASRRPHAGCLLKFSPMQILANALPGFRDLRGPVIAGYLWLIFAWLITAPEIDARPAGGVGAAGYDLAVTIGKVGVAIAVSVGAYLLGSVSHELSRLLRQAWVRWERVPLRARGGGRVVGESGSEGPPAMAAYKRGDALLRVRFGPEEAIVDPAYGALVGQLQQELSDRAQRTDYEAEREVDLPATLLVGDRPELFAEVDRLRAEGELRLAVAPPISALIILLAATASLWWLLAFPAGLILFVQGIQRNADSKRVIADAIQLGRIESSSLARFTNWVDALPAEIDRRVAQLQSAPP